MKGAQSSQTSTNQGPSHHGGRGGRGGKSKQQGAGGKGRQNQFRQGGQGGNSKQKGRGRGGGGPSNQNAKNPSLLSAANFPTLSGEPRSSPGPAETQPNPKSSAAPSSAWSSSGPTLADTIAANAAKTQPLRPESHVPHPSRNDYQQQQQQQPYPQGFPPVPNMDIRGDQQNYNHPNQFPPQGGPGLVPDNSGLNFYMMQQAMFAAQGGNAGGIGVGGNGGNGGVLDDEDPSGAPPSGTSYEAIRHRVLQQISYYLSPKNKDETINGKQDQNGWVSVDYLAEYKKVKELLASGSSSDTPASIRLSDMIRGCQRLTITREGTHVRLRRRPQRDFRGQGGMGGAGASAGNAMGGRGGRGRQSAGRGGQGQVHANQYQQYYQAQAQMNNFAVAAAAAAAASGGGANQWSGMPFMNPMADPTLAAASLQMQYDPSAMAAAGGVPFPPYFPPITGQQQGLGGSLNASGSNLNTGGSNLMPEQLMAPAQFMNQFQQQQQQQRQQQIGGPGMQPVDYFLVIDFEATCDRTEQPELQEIIEFPAVLINGHTLQIEDEFHAYVRPQTNAILSEFCVQLTGIQQDWVDKGRSLSETLVQFDQWLKQHGLGDTYSFSIITDGPWDLGKFLHAQCEAQKIARANYFDQWVNLRQLYSEFFGCPRMSVFKMLSRLGMEFEGRPHSGLADSRNISRIAIRMMQSGCILSINDWIGKAPDSELYIGVPSPSKQSATPADKTANKQ